MASNKIALAYGYEDAQTWLEETTSELWPAAVASGTLGADEALINALGSAKVAALFAVATGSEEFVSACRDYSSEFARVVRKAIERVAREESSAAQ